MKNTIISFCVFTTCLFVMSAVKGQDTSASDKGRFYVSVGVGKFSGNWFGDVRVTEYNQFAIEPATCYQASVKYFLNKKIAIGVAACYYEYHDESNVNYPVVEYLNPALIDYQMVNRRYKYRLKTLVLAAEGTVIYYKEYKTSRQLYGTAGIGLAHITGAAEEATTSYFPNDPSLTAVNNYSETRQINENKLKAHLTFLGIRGGKKICWYAEGGYGFKGLVNVGVAVKL